MPFPHRWNVVFERESISPGTLVQLIDSGFRRRKAGAMRTSFDPRPLIGSTMLQATDLCPTNIRQIGRTTRTPITEATINRYRAFHEGTSHGPKTSPAIDEHRL